MLDDADKMTTLKSFVDSVLLSSTASTGSSTMIQCLLTYPLNTKEFNFDISDQQVQEFYTFDLYRVIHHVFTNYLAQKSVQTNKLLQHSVEFSKPDIIFQYLMEQLLVHSEDEWTSLITSQIEKFVFSHQRLTEIFSFWADTLRDCVNDKSVLETRVRSVVNLPSRFANIQSVRHKFRLLNKVTFVVSLLSVFKSNVFDADEHFQLCGLLLSQLALNGYGSEMAEFILNDTAVILNSSSEATTRSNWSKALCYLKSSSVEACLQPILSKGHHPCIVASLLSNMLDGSNPPLMKVILKLFRRLLFVRYFPHDQILRNLFGGLAHITCYYCSPSNASYLVDQVNKDLGLPLLRLWADASAIQSASLEQRVYTSQALASWFTDFHEHVESKLSIRVSDSLMLPDVLTGISNHLASPRSEIRTIGMAVGEWLVSLLDLPCGDKQHGSLRFEYEEIEMVKRIRPLFIPLPAFSPGTTEKKIFFSESANADNHHATEVSHSVSNETTAQLDSDDEPDTSDPTNAPFEHLPQRPGQPKMVHSVLSHSRKPRYLRECLDGMLYSKPEDSHISVACYTSAEELIYAHPTAARELANDFAHVFVHMDLPACPEESRLASCRHKALVALGTVAPKECARYLTNEFCQPTCSVGQRQNIISAITDIACQLSSDRKLDKQETSPILVNDKRTPTSLMSSKLLSQTRRFCSRPPPTIQTTNAFASVAGEFFFPLLRSIPQLFTGSHTGTFAHQDASLLGNLIAALGILYMCARFSSVQDRMATELLELAPILYGHKEPAVRRAVLIAIGTVITTTPTSLISANPHLFLMGSPSLRAIDSANDSGFSVARWLKQCSSTDNDSECKLLASVGLSALVERSEELFRS